MTVSASWKHKYDQGGLCLIVNSTHGPRKWVKTGIEFLNDQAHVSTVATDRWSDWSLRPTLGLESKPATIELDSNADGSLWVWLVAENGEKSPAREVTWWADLGKDEEVWIGVYAAKPAKEAEDLEVSFKDLKITLK